MRIKIDENETGYTMWLSANDTENWATKPGSVCPCSVLEGRRCMVCVDSNGLYDMTIDGKDSRQHDISGDEIDAIVGDYLPWKARHLWPTWE